MIVSKNGIALVVIVAEALLSSLGVEFEAGSVEKGIEGALIVVALLLAAWNQLARVDSKWFIFKQ